MADCDGARLRSAHVAITGGCGFIGSALVRRVVELGARKVTVIDDLSAGRPFPDGVERHELSLGAVPQAAVRERLEGVDYLVHLAAVKHNDVSRSADTLLRVNVTGTHDLFSAAADVGVRRVVFASSLYAHGRRAEPAMREDEVALPDTLYGAAKLMGERMLAAVARRTGLSGNSLRYFFAFGPGGRGAYRSVVDTTFERLARGEPPVINGDGRQVLDYVYVDDVVDATVAALRSDVEGEVLNVCTGRGVAVADLIRAITEVAGARWQPKWAPADDTHGTYRVGDPELCAGVLGFRPTWSLEAALEETHRLNATATAGQ